MKSVLKNSKYSIGERVLCYEPDLTKARVVYDAKILKIDCPETTKKNACAKDCHYLIHFQGWSSTWDRYVTEEFLLKITEENRALQRKLFQEAEAMTKAMKKRKKHRHRSAESSVSGSSMEDPGPSSKRSKKTHSPQSSLASSENDLSPHRGLTVEPPSNEELSLSTATVSPLSKSSRKSMATRVQQRSASQDGAEVENQAPIKLSEDLKSILEQDYYRVTRRKVLPNLPSCPNVASVLEDYVRHFSTNNLVNFEKQLSKTYYTASRKETTRDLMAKVTENIHIAKEVADGIRIIFDFTLKPALLYGSHGETKQYTECMKPGVVKKRPIVIQEHELCGDVQEASRRPSINEIASSRSSTTSGRSSATPSLGNLNPSSASPTSPQAIKVLKDLQEWRIIPDTYYEDSRSQKPLECMVYGPIHLLRLFVKLPEILNQMNLPVRSKKLVMKYIDTVVDYLQSHQDLFSQNE